MLSRIGLLRGNVSAVRSLAPVSRICLSRTISTVKTSNGEEDDILRAQRKNRPVSPHLTIYQPQLTWIMSSAHRLTGIILASSFYGLTCTYAATSLIGIPFDATTIISAFAALPVFFQILVKACLGYPFVFHFWNGIRHLIWDFGKELSIPGVYRTGYFVLGATVILGSCLTFL